MPRVGQQRREVVKLRLPQLRILRVLAEGQLLTKAKISQRCGFSPVSGTITSAINGVREGSSSGGARPGLLVLGLITKRDLDIDGIVEQVYQITNTGRLALAQTVGEKELPELRSKESSTNLRYKEE